MRHAFSFPVHIREAVREHVRQAITKVDPDRFRQEPDYIVALLAHLDGIAYDRADGFVGFKATSVNSVGRKRGGFWIIGGWAGKMNSFSTTTKPANRLWI
jgi:hypothetical protein